MDHDIEAALSREWRTLREAGRLRPILPDCGTRQWMRGDACAGYVTVDYCVQRNVQFPGARGATPGVASIVEKYWSVRTINGRQDPTWRPSVNVHVVHVRNHAVTCTDAEDLLRNAWVARQAVWSAGRGDRAPAAQATLYVRAALLGTRVGDDVNLLSQAEAFRDIPFRAGEFTFSLADGFTFAERENDEWFDCEVGLYHWREIVEFGERLIGDDLLPLQHFAWRGVNTGPVYDCATGLTTHDGKVL